jgi:hypothetical protein
LILLTTILLAFTVRVYAAQVEVPVEIDYLVLDAALKQRFYTAAGGRAVFWQGPANCGHLYATDPHFSQAGSDIRLISAADLQAALALAGQCLSAMSWNGKLAAVMTPRIEGSELKFHIKDVEFINADGRVIGGDALNMMKGQLLGQLGNFSYNLRPYIDRVQSILNEFPAREVTAEVQPILASLKLGEQVVAGEHGVTVTLLMALPANLLEKPSGALMTAEEKTAWRAAASKIESVLTELQRQLPPLIVDPQLSDQIMGVISDARTQIRAMANTPPPGGDPLPALRNDWQRLAIAARAAAYRSVFGERSVEILEAVALGDVIFAIDQRAPALGSRIALGGLQELIRETGSSSTQPAPLS